MSLFLIWWYNISSHVLNGYLELTYNDSTVASISIITLKEKQTRKEELNRLKNLKKQEIEDKLQHLKAKSGAESMPFTGEELEEDFDPDEHDRKMKVCSNC